MQRISDLIQSPLKFSFPFREQKGENENFVENEPIIVKSIRQLAK